LSENCGGAVESLAAARLVIAPRSAACVVITARPAGSSRPPIGTARGSDRGDR
jgi:hypothetical protein